ncbi:guanitoxin biosynthesis heme-dependent pre-guanitoxin N-hydroxylase GntA [Tundrisphaera sp. TA3]|uniref:guanitoxin biosynthesis heme-dependent pre-guanitoxin N-hydroxylase GntA n=1 Tax=Tundrisphaera sp. TA3 TaxID=3435775 RepID=UPI003EC08DFF
MTISVASPATAPTCPHAAAGVDNPFDSEIALRNSQYYGTKGGRAVLLSRPGSTPDLFASAAVGAFRGFVLNPDFSCVGAKSAVMHETYRLGVYDQLAGDGATAGLARDLYTFARESEGADPHEFRTFVAMFRGPMDVDEEAFERMLWDQLRRLNELDAPLHRWDPSVSQDPESPHFGFSFAEMAFFIVGLHPHSSREARRFIWPTLVFNPHAQFQHLKEDGRWERLQEVIRTREEHLQGSLNPNLADYGTATEARQYSGRAVEADWHPPFHPTAHHDAPAGASGCPFHAVLRSES